ncbi:hypothetical protein GobsT_12400 [Gemmata obscuriglobus]|nr:hypothetical protein GobsT_12400 [Gemmata obscuriglobus]VTS01788.1 unnamed protein product [Gemmata obscuriglobus UQM 2246]
MLSVINVSMAQHRDTVRTSLRSTKRNPVPGVNWYRWAVDAITYPLRAKNTGPPRWPHRVTARTADPAGPAGTSNRAKNSV